MERPQPGPVAGVGFDRRGEGWGMGIALERRINRLAVEKFLRGMRRIGAEILEDSNQSVLAVF
jgi:hypothetical protein